MKRETTQTDKMTNGEEVKPCKQVAADAGWTVRNPDPRDNGYTGENQPWRR